MSDETIIKDFTCVLESIAMAALHLSVPVLPLCKRQKAMTSSASSTTQRSSIKRNVIKNSHLTSDTNSPLSINRRNANYQPTIWHDSYIQSLHFGFTEEKYISRRRELMEDVRSLFRQPRGAIQQLELFDTCVRSNKDIITGLFEEKKTGFNSHIEHDINGLLNIYEASFLAKEGEDEFNDAR
ncbi:hypothetical protein HPP92_011188 [Vanilla planifolia]|uniref:Terpene synthase N-terminal domain-containing protein n=1 Tax=Vanilla planifolia TaxID=51239 RepID=A0A835R6K3_VANPL|nr:hypothetical protein HPP92_011188 [Vanilla planifolia]